MNKIIDELKDKRLIKDYYIRKIGNGQEFNIPNEKLSEEAKRLIELGEYKLSVNDDGSLRKFIAQYTILGDKYQEILKKLEIKKLEEGEAILLDNRYLEGSKVGDNFRETNYKVGDILTFYDEITEFKQEVKIIAITDDLEPYFERNESWCILLVNEETVQDYYKKLWGDNKNDVDVFISTDKSYEIDKCLEKYELENNASNTYQYKLSDASKREVIKVAVYTFIILITLLTIINIINIITSSITLRKKDLAILKSMGMSEKQINKMLILEGIFDGLDALIFGMLISVVILYIMYLFMIDIKIYKFTVSYANIAISVIVTYLVIFIAILNSKRKLKKQNIIDEIREENI